MLKILNNRFWNVQKMTKLFLLISLDPQHLYAVLPLRWCKDYGKLTHFAALGISHVSLIIGGNVKSLVNAHLLDWVCKGEFTFTSLLMETQVALNRKSLLSF